MAVHSAMSPRSLPAVARFLGALLLACLLGAHAAHAARPYTVDDMLRTEAIGKVRFDPEGRYLVFERYGPFDAQSDFGRPLVIGQMRSRLFRFDLEGAAGARPLFDQQESDTYTLNTLSPDGAFVSYLRGSATGLAAGSAAAPFGGGR